ETKGRKYQIFCAEGKSFPRCHGQKESKLARVSRASYGKRCLAYPPLSQHQGAIGVTWGALKTPWLGPFVPPDARLSSKRKRRAGRKHVPSKFVLRKRRNEVPKTTPLVPACARTGIGDQPLRKLNHGFLAGRGFELFRISDSGVRVAGLP